MSVQYNYIYGREGEEEMGYDQCTHERDVGVVKAVVDPWEQSAINVHIEA